MKLKKEHAIEFVEWFNSANMCEGIDCHCYLTVTKAGYGCVAVLDAYSGDIAVKVLDGGIYSSRNGEVASTTPRKFIIAFLYWYSTMVFGEHYDHEVHKELREYAEFFEIEY